MLVAALETEVAAYLEARGDEPTRRAMPWSRLSVDKLSVVLVIALSALTFGERLTWRVSCGALLVVVGALLVSLPSSR